MPRSGGRKGNQIRSLHSEIGPLTRADGSSRFSHGDTSILTSVYGPMEAKVSEQLPRAFIKSIVLPKTGNATYLHKTLEQQLQSVAEQLIYTNNHPRTVIQVTSQLMEDNGSVLSCAVNSMCMALIDAGVVLKDMFGSTTIALLEAQDVEQDAMKTPSGKVLYLDPTEKEEEIAIFVGTFVYNGHSSNPVLIQSYGECNVDDYKYVLKIACRTVKTIISFTKLSFEQKLKKEHC